MSFKKLERDIVPLQNAEREALANYEKNNISEDAREAYENAAMKLLEFEVRFEIEKEKLNLCEKVYTEAVGHVVH